MVIAGAKGFAKEVLEVLHRDFNYKNIYFYDDLNRGLPESFYQKFIILHSEKDLKEVLNKDPEFVLGIGLPSSRNQLYKLFTKQGGVIKSVIAKTAITGSFDTVIEEGCTIMDNVIISNNVKIGIGSLLNVFTFVAHDARIGKFADIAPRVTISGNCVIGDYVTIGTNAVILPKVNIGRNVLIGAGSVVKNNIPSNSLVIGSPGKVIKKLPELLLD